ncbi:hypothetical protein CJF32_00010703 [Rutstroemia sp. NJR-2017a WRK4]|nr:hypothetical protein CJF32_00010703 [Rutstroemia sp. NJR-2017a WRK4]
MLGLTQNVLLAVTMTIGSVLAATPDQWRERSIYQVFTDRFARTDSTNTTACPSQFYGYCGGTWRGIINKLDYIQDMGFTAIWISPVVEQVADPRRGFHGYSAQNLYGLNSHFGNASDLIALATALHERNMAGIFFYLMVDVVANHMGSDATANTVDYSIMHPFNSSSYFHSVCFIEDNNNQTQIEHCDLGNNAYPLPDLNTTQPAVRDLHTAWIKYLVSTYSTTSKNLVGQFQEQNKKCKDTTLLGSFTENHDLPRFGNYTSDLALAKNIVTYTMLTDGIPIIYQGQEQHFHGGTDPYDREPLWPTNYNTTSPLYVLVKQLNAIRSLAIARSNTYSTTQTKVAYADDHNIAFQKGDPKSMVLMVLNNLGEKAENYTVKMEELGFEGELLVTDVLSCRNATVDDRGGLDVQFIGGLPSGLAGVDSKVISKQQTFESWSGSNP